MEDSWNSGNGEKIKNLRGIFEAKAKVFGDSGKERKVVKRILRLG